MVECEECGKNLHVDPVEKPNTDWVKVVCSDCGTVRDVSMVRVNETSRRN